MNVTYPVIFTEIESNILIEIPDLQILTEANEEGKEKASMSEAIMMARDAIGLAIISAEDEEREIKEASFISQINVEDSTFYQKGSSFVSLVDVDVLEYRRKQDNRAVRRNVTLPNWLNREADKAHINVSKVLQEALLQTLGVSK